MTDLLHALEAIEAERGDLVSKHNSLTRAAYRLTLQEQRLVLLAISKIDSRKLIPKPITLRADEYAEVYGIPLSQAYRAMKDGVKDLYERSFRPADDKCDSDDGWRWIDRKRHNAGEGTVDIWFTSHMRPYLAMLNGTFTQYRLRQIGNLNSIHSIRLFEVLVSWRSSGRYIVKLDDFKRMFCLSGSAYDRFSNLRIRVIDPAVTELNEKTAMNISYMAIKEGKAIGRLEFNFTAPPLDSL